MGKGRERAPLHPLLIGSNSGMQELGATVLPKGRLWKGKKAGFCNQTSYHIYYKLFQCLERSHTWIKHSMSALGQAQTGVAT